MNTQVKEQLDLLYNHPSDITGNSGNTDWEFVTIENDASGNEDTFELPLNPENEKCILPFINGLSTPKFTYDSDDNTITFTDGNVGIHSLITAFILEKQ